MLKQICKLFVEFVMMPNDDKRMVALRKYATAALPGSGAITVRALRDDSWAWVSAERDGESISIDVRNVPSATAALAAALQCVGGYAKDCGAKAAEVAP